MTYFDKLAAVLTHIDPAPLVPFVRACEGTLWLAGNGGSAAVAQHWACDLSKAAGRRVQALGTNSAVLTAWANDESYANALANELEALARPGDRLICLSCSGTSPNIINVLRMSAAVPVARALVTTMRESSLACFPVDVLIELPATDYGILEDCFAAIGHWLTKELA